VRRLHRSVAIHIRLDRGSLGYLLASATALLALCGLGFWWLEPTALTWADGLWLAFTTAATVGYGDIVPSTPASKVFSVFVVMLGFGVLSLVTAAIASRWIKTEERIIEREVLRDMHREMAALHRELAALRQNLAPATGTRAATAVGEPADAGTDTGADPPAAAVAIPGAGAAGLQKT
jgi:voltage-gated potassium channel